MKKQKNSFRSKLKMFALLALFLYFVFGLVKTQIDISAKRQELAAVDNSLQEQLAANDELNRELASGDQAIIERAARDELGYARPNERIFVDVSGK